MPEPVLVSIAAALAGKTAMSLYDLVKKKFASRAEAKAALAAAEGAPADSPQVRTLAAELERAESTDPEFGSELRTLWTSVSVQQQAGNGSVSAQISGTVNKSVIARDIGEVRF